MITTNTHLQTYPLSYNQQGIWLYQQQAPQSTAYNTGIAMQVLSEVNLDALQRTFQAILNRHAALRAVVFLQEDIPVQQILDTQQLTFTYIDATGWDEGQLRAAVLQAHRQPYNFEQGPFFRVHLFTQSPTRHVLLLGAHHLVMDAESWWQVLDDAQQLYPAFCKGHELELPVQAHQYTDFVAHEEHMLQRRGEKLGTYWQSHLADVPLQLDLPTDCPRPPVLQFNGSIEFFVLSRTLTSALNKLANQEKMSLNVLLFAAFQVLLYRYSQQETFVVGIPTSVQVPGLSDAVVGNFINILPLCADLSENSSVKELIRRVWRTLMMGLRNQAYRFPLLVQEIDIPHNPAVTPVVQVLINFPQVEPEFAPFLITVPDEEESSQVIDWAELSIAPYRLPQQEGSFDLGVEVVQATERCLGQIRYNVDLFTPETVQRMAGHLQTLLEAMVAEYPLGLEQPIHQLPMLTEAEYHQIVHEWNDTAIDFGEPQPFHILFEQQVAQTPNATAIVFEDMQLTYAELNHRANQLAHGLRSQKIIDDAEKIVGVCMERCPEMVVSLLAVFKAGGVYLPLDPNLPQERLAYMLTHADAQIVLTKQSYLEYLSGPDIALDIPLIALDKDRARISKQPTHNLPNYSAPEQLAYVIYTSGSTGLPKGAMVEHQGMVNHLYAKVHDLDLTAKDRIAETAPQSFDISIWQFLAGFLVGGAVHIFDDETVRDPARLLTRTEAEQITILEVVPSLFRFMLDELAIAQTVSDNIRPQFATLRWLLLTGEALPPHLCEEWFGYYPNIPLMNAYGPTECSDDVTHHAIYEPLPHHVTSTPIGRTVANMQLYILDEYRQPVSIGVPGELYVGGIGVGRGYLNDPERTAQAFLDDPFGQGLGRFYKTGDLVRYQPDGVIEFLGRTDFQVKPGFRSYQARNRG